MTRKQLLVHGTERGGSELRVVDNPDNLDPWSLEDRSHGFEAPALGTQPLVLLAAGMAAQGFDVLGVEVRRGNGSPFYGAEELSENLTELIASGRSKEALGLLSSGTFGSVVVVAIRLSDRNSALQFSIDMNGVVKLHPDAEPPTAPLWTVALNDAWQKWAI